MNEISSTRFPDWNRFLPQSTDEIPNPVLAARHRGQSVVITGAGGFIGSALTATVAAAGPARLVLLESSEHHLFELDRKLDAGFPGVPRVVVLGNCGDPQLLDEILKEHKPDIIYHAAAFKHVPLLERNPFAALRNNILCTYHVARAALRHGAPKLVLISSDKAVHPHSVLGASKRISELLVTTLSNPACGMNAVRLANVIGSTGSVVPIFLSQISAGGPVTVTHPEVTRRFLTGRDTIAAILRCGTETCGARILLPESGEPLRIADLARFLIDATTGARQRMIDIVYTGLRPGDKLKEELRFDFEVTDSMMDGCGQVVTTRTLTPAKLNEQMDNLVRIERTNDVPRLLAAFSELVPEYIPSSTSKAYFRDAEAR